MGHGGELEARVNEAFRLSPEDVFAFLASLRGHNGDVNSAAFSPDGKRVVTVSALGRGCGTCRGPPGSEETNYVNAYALSILARSERCCRCLDAEKAPRDSCPAG
jgi:hypothetical protein